MRLKYLPCVHSPGQSPWWGQFCMEEEVPFANSHKISWTGQLSRGPGSGLHGDPQQRTACTEILDRRQHCASERKVQTEWWERTESHVRKVKTTQGSGLYQVPGLQSDSNWRPVSREKQSLDRIFILKDHSVCRVEKELERSNQCSSSGQRGWCLRLTLKQWERNAEV